VCKKLPQLKEKKMYSDPQSLRLMAKVEMPTIAQACVLLANILHRDTGINRTMYMPFEVISR